MQPFSARIDALRALPGVPWGQRKKDGAKVEDGEVRVGPV